ncbi:MAG TPA: mandelate racemase/muconate lactonizing enzyme family protein [Chloroflexota bacterium]|nr:mandelate racemase/muconate lactonizing enzyme family protein [Chloroflexota bacterium]
MKIAAVEVQLLRDVPTPRELRFAWAPGSTTRSSNITLVRLRSDDGLEGIGSGGAPDALRGIGQQLIGRDPFATEQHSRLLRRGGNAWGLEVALWDLIGKACGQPLYKLWGGYTERVKGYASTIEIGSPEGRAQDALGFYEEGFRAIKLRLHNETLEQDIKLARAVKDAVGDKMELMADGNQAQTPVTPSAQPGVIWDYRRALYTARALEEMGFVWLEEPLSRYDFEGLSRLNAATALAIAGGENNRYLHEFHWLLEQGCYDILQPDGLVSEGIGQLRKVAALAEVRAKLCVPHHGGGGIGTYAHLHFSAAVPNSPWIELMRDRPGEFPWPAQLVPATPIMVGPDGYVPLPSAAGLGIELDEAFVRRYAA